MVAMDEVFVLAGVPVDVDTLDLFEIVMSVVRERRKRGHKRIRGRDLWLEVSKRESQFLRCALQNNLMLELERGLNGICVLRPDY